MNLPYDWAPGQRCSFRAVSVFFEWMWRGERVGFDDVHSRLVDVAAAVADGLLVDWDAVESSEHDDTERLLIRRLRAIEDIGRAQAGLTFDSSSISRSDSLSDSPDPAATAEAASLLTWGPLRIVEKVGRGRFGDVYRAFDPALDREVALKLLKRRDADPAGDDRLVE